jgi:hypothetical protein
MAKIAQWEPTILIGLGAATLSSAIGSILVAPRTLQALGKDRVFEIRAVSRRRATAGEEAQPDCVSHG